MARPRDWDLMRRRSKVERPERPPSEEERRAMEAAVSPALLETVGEMLARAFPGERKGQRGGLEASPLSHSKRRSASGPHTLHLGAIAIARRTVLDSEQRAFRSKNREFLADALPFAVWERHGYGTNKKPVARRPLPGGTDEKWYRAGEVHKRRRRAPAE